MSTVVKTWVSVVVATGVFVGGVTADKLTSPTIRVYFSPNGGAQEALLAKISNAKTSVDVEAYAFTSKTIAAALVTSKKRGVVVRVCMDDWESKAVGSVAPDLRAGGIDFRADSQEHIAHSKVMIIDGLATCTGSYNYSDNAEHRNHENLVVIPSAAVAAAYKRDFEEHWAHSK